MVVYPSAYMWFCSLTYIHIYESGFYRFGFLVMIASARIWWCVCCGDAHKGAAFVEITAQQHRYPGGVEVLIVNRLL